MNVLSLFDGISCLQVALSRAGIKHDAYYASEINKHAIKVTQYHYPGTIQLGDVRHIDFDALPNIDLIAAGSPCQNISTLNRKDRLGLKGEKSSLFYYFLEAKAKWPHAKWIVENVEGHGSAEITRELKTRPIKLNSNWIVPQKRPRLYWTNIPVNSLPNKTNLKLTDLLDENVEGYYQSEGWLKWWGKSKDKQLSMQLCSLDAEIANCLTARMYRSWAGNFVTQNGRIRRLTPIECERLQTLPEGYTSVISDNQAYEAIGNGWTVDIIVHLLKHLNNGKTNFRSTI